MECGGVGILGFGTLGMAWTGAFPRMKTPLIPWKMECGGVGILGFGTLGMAAELGVPIPRDPGGLKAPGPKPR